MNAAIIQQHGPLEEVVVDDVPEPQCKPGEVRVSVKAAALNHLDIHVRRGRPGHSLEMPHTLGSDAAGVIDHVCEQVEGFSVGDEVVINPGLRCGQCEFCRRGQQSQCVHYSLLGLGRAGTFAEKVTVPAYAVYHKPARLSWAEAAALPLAYLTAWRMVMTVGRLCAGETVLIHGIGGGVALAALQWVKLAGARAIVTSSSDDKLTRAGELGADETINYTEVDDLPKRVRHLTDGRGVDLVIDTVGAATIGPGIASVRRGGRMVLCGVTSGAQAEVNLQAVYWNHVQILGSTMGSDEDFRRMLNAADAAGLRPHIDSTFPLSEAREAMGRMERGEQFGKIVLEVS